MFAFDEYFFAPTADRRDLANRIISDHRPIGVALVGDSLGALPSLDAASGGFALGAWHFDGAIKDTDDHTAIALLSLGLMRFSVVAMLGFGPTASVLDVALADLAGEYAYATFEKSGQFVYRSDKVSLAGEPAADASLSIGGQAPLCAAFDTADGLRFRVCSYGDAAVRSGSLPEPPTSAGSLLLAGTQLPSASDAWRAVGDDGLVLVPASATATRADVNTETPPSGAVLIDTAVSLPLRDWFLPRLFADSIVAKVWLGTKMPALVHADVGDSDIAPPDPPTVDEARALCPLILSEYVDGDGNDNAVEVTNFGESDVDLSDVQVSSIFCYFCVPARREEKKLTLMALFCL